MKTLRSVLASFPLGLLGLASAEPPDLSFSLVGDEAIDVSVVGGAVEEGWVLQDTYNGADWRDLDVLEEGPVRFFLSAAPTETRLFRAVQKSLLTRQEALTQARARWQAAGLLNYQYRSRSTVSGFLTDDLTLVEGGSVKEWVSLLPPGFPGFASGDQTIEDLFNRLQGAIDNEAHMMMVRYHPTLGYPESAYVDLSELIADEEWGITISEPPADPEESRAKNERKWKGTGVESYEYDLRYQTAWFGWEGTIRVSGGTAMVVGGEEPVLGHIVMTMDECFSYIGGALAEGDVSSAAYDPELGYPQFFSRDWYLVIVDGPGERFWISGFRVLGGQ